MLPQIVVFFCVAILNTILAFSLQKCCPINHVFNYNYCHESNLTWAPKLLTDYINITWSIPVNISKNYNLSCKRLVFLDSVVTQYFYLESGNLVKRDQLGVQYRDFCLDQTPDGDTVALTCPCAKGGVCVNVCCEENQLIDTYSRSKAKCVQAENTTPDWKVAESERHFYVNFNAKPMCPPETGGTEILNRLNLENRLQQFEFEVLANGTLSVYNEKFMEWMDPSQYCVGIFKQSNESMPSMNVLHCKKDQTPIRRKAAIYVTLFVIGAIFYLATLLVHALVPDLRRAVRGLSLIAHCACMLAAHIVLVVLQFIGSSVSDVPCQILGYGSQFTLIGSFFWLNVMCIDISITFRSMKNMARSLDLDFSSELRKFLWYCVYAFVVPFLLMVVTLGVDHSSLDYRSTFKPNIGLTKCWFEKYSIAAVIYFYGPSGLILLINIFLFIYVGCKITSKNSLLQNMSISVQRRQRKRFILFAKLGALMGIPWIMEIVGWAAGGEDHYWYFTDAINLLRSIFIFIVFCCKQKVWEMLKKKSILAPIVNWSSLRFNVNEIFTPRDQHTHSTQSSSVDSADSTGNRNMELRNSTDLQTSAGVTNPAFDATQ